MQEINCIMHYNLRKRQKKILECALFKFPTIWDIYTNVAHLLKLFSHNKQSIYCLINRSTLNRLQKGLVAEYKRFPIHLSIHKEIYANNKHAINSFYAAAWFHIPEIMFEACDTHLYLIYFRQLRNLLKIFQSSCHWASFIYKLSLNIYVVWSSINKYLIL